jgi:hypothetical protein
MKRLRRSRPNRVLCIAMSIEAFEAIARTLLLGSVGYEAQMNDRGNRYV